MRKKLRFPLAAALVVGLVAVFTIVGMPGVAEAKTKAQMTPDEEVKSLIYYRVVANCMQQGTLADGAFIDYHQRVSSAHANSGDYFAGSKHKTGSYLGADSEMECNDAVKGGMKLWEFAGDVLLCKSGFLRVDYNDASKCTNDQGGGGKDFWRKGSGEASAKAFRQAVMSKVYGGKTPELTDAANYQMYYTIFANTCGSGKMSGTGTPTGAPTNFATNGYDYSIGQVGDDGKVTYAHVVGKEKGSTKVSTTPPMSYSPASSNAGGGNSNQPNQDTCRQLEGRINQYVAAYATYQKNHSNASSVSGQNAESSDDDSETSSCSVDGVGWIVCPVMNFLGSLSDATFGLVSSYLQVQPQLTTSDTTKTAWSTMRNIANVMFVVAFLIIIYSQITGGMLSNYNIKRMLPRVIIAALLVNLSLYICQLAVDLSNVLGWSLKGLFDGMANSVTGASSALGDASGNGWGIAVIVAAILAGGSYALISLGIGVIIAALLALLLILLILMLRKALILILIVVAPIAFVAYLLPNTEQYFKKWGKMFIGLLLVFPIIGVVFGASNLAARIVSSASSDANDSGVALSAMAIAALPLFIVPSLLKRSLDATGQLGAKLSGAVEKQQGKASAKAAEQRKNSRPVQLANHLKQRSQLSKTQAQAGVYKGRNILRRAQSGINGAFNRSRLSGSFGDQSAAAGIALANKQDKEAVTNQEAALRQTNTNVGEALTKALQSGDSVKARAAQNVLFSQGNSGITAFRAAVTAAEQSEGGANGKALKDLKQNTLETHGQTAKGKAADIAHWATPDEEGAAAKTMQQASHEDYKGMSQADLAGQSAATLEAIQNGIDPNTAQAVLANERLAANIDPEQRAQLEKSAKNATASAKLNVDHTPKTTPSTRGGNRTPVSREEREYYSGDDRRD